MKLSEQGKLELGLVKSSSARWQSLGSSKTDHNWFGNIKVRNLFIRNLKYAHLTPLFSTT